MKKIPTHFEMAQAQVAIEAVLKAARDNSTVEDWLLGLELLIQGAAILGDEDAERLRDMVAASARSGISPQALLASMATKGTA